ncbi:MerR family DNA-binding protein [Microbispora sp. CA-135349]|uniref:MerR family DNA-binding protein n=1 Tax=Microbispora sp. CA-135349 TaxID=3239953 RepID=UPI003D89C37A
MRRNPRSHERGERGSPTRRRVLVRVALILMGKEAGLGLRELRAVLSTPDPMDHRDLLRRHVVELEQRIARARAAKDLIEHALACPHRFADCPHAREQIAVRIPVGQTDRAADTY